MTSRLPTHAVLALLSADTSSDSPSASFLSPDAHASARYACVLCRSAYLRRGGRAARRAREERRARRGAVEELREREHQLRVVLVAPRQRRRLAEAIAAAAVGRRREQRGVQARQ